MTIEMKQKLNTLTVCVTGRINSDTALQLDAAVKERLGQNNVPAEDSKRIMNKIKKIIFDFSATDSISSAGLRIILSVYKQMDEEGSIVVREANSSVYETFVITGFDKFIAIGRKKI